LLCSGDSRIAPLGGLPHDLVVVFALGDEAAIRHPNVLAVKLTH